MSKKDKHEKSPEQPKAELNKDLLPLERYRKYTLDEKKKPDFKSFIANNWVREMTDDGVEAAEIKNKTLNTLYHRGSAVWLSPEGNIVYRSLPDAKPVELASDDKAKRVFCALLKVNNIRFFKGYTAGEKRIPPDVAARELLLVEEEFTPFAPSEFYLHEGRWKRTSFAPTEHLLANGKSYDVKKHPKTIEKLIIHLANYNNDYYDWMMNWFAGFFQTLEKSSVALVLKGVQGSGKSVFFDHVITPLFGEKYCVVVDQGRIESQFKNWIENRIFFNLNEVAVDMKGRKDLKNFLKQLVTDRYVYAELKHKDAEPVRIYGNIYITSNEHLPVEIEPSDRRFTVFDTAGNIRELGWDTKQLIADIESELIYFARFLKAHKVDWDMYHTALDTPEKRAIQSGTNSKLSLYLKAVLKRDAEIFTGLLELTDDYQGNRNLHASIIADLENGTIDQTNLIQAYKKMYEVDHSPRKIMENIRMMEPAVFAKEKMKITSGSKYYSLPGK